MKRLKCCGCKDYFDEDQLIKLPAGRFHSMECAISYAKSKQDKARAKQMAKAKREHTKEQKARRAQNRADKDRVKTRKEWYDQLQTLVNQWVVHVRDKNKPCCTCGTTNDIKYDAGHYRSRGACPELRFEPTNIHKQCSVQCNQFGSGMRAEYREFIVGEYGQNHLDWLDGSHQRLKERFSHYTDIKSEIARYRKLLRDSGIKPYV